MCILDTHIIECERMFIFQIKIKCPWMVSFRAYMVSNFRSSLFMELQGIVSLILGLRPRLGQDKGNMLGVLNQSILWHKHTPINARKCNG
jgi:hypothetical protein